MGSPTPTNDSKQTKTKLNGRFRNIDGEATNKQVSLDMTDTPFTKFKCQTTLHLNGSNQTTRGRKESHLFPLLAPIKGLQILNLG